MKRILRIVGVVFGVFLVLIGAVLAFVLVTAQPTKGPQIPAYVQPRSAILVVDIQEEPAELRRATFTAGTPSGERRWLEFPNA